jgi:hypothetical protein
MSKGIGVTGGLLLLLLLLLVQAACAGGGPRGSPATQSPPSSAAIDQFRLASYKRIDPNADPKGGAPVYIVDQDVILLAHTRGISRVDVILATGGAAPAVAANSAAPDAQGFVEVQMHLPERGKVYYFEAHGVIDEGIPLQLGEGVGDPWERLVVAGPVRVMAESQPTSAEQRCRAGDLDGHAEVSPTGLGVLVGSIELVSHASTPCSLEGYPAVQMQGANGPLTWLSVTRVPASDSDEREVVIQPSGVAYLPYEFTEWCLRDVKALPLSFILGLPGDEEDLAVPVVGALNDRLVESQCPGAEGISSTLHIGAMTSVAPFPSQAP